MTRPSNNRRDGGQAKLRSLAAELGVTIERAPLPDSWFLFEEDGTPIRSERDTTRSGGRPSQIPGKVPPVVQRSSSPRSVGERVAHFRDHDLPDQLQPDRLREVVEILDVQDECARAADHAS